MTNTNITRRPKRRGLPTYQGQRPSVVTREGGVVVVSYEKKVL